MQGQQVTVDDLLPDVLLFPPATDLHDHPLVKSSCLILQACLHLLSILRPIAEEHFVWVSACMQMVCRVHMNGVGIRALRYSLEPEERSAGTA